jgi:hypothetical protein
LTRENGGAVSRSFAETLGTGVAGIVCLNDVIDVIATREPETRLYRDSELVETFALSASARLRRK